MNRRQFLGTAIALTASTVSAQGDYSQIANLNYSSIPKSWLIQDAYVAPCCFCDVMQMQSYLRTGIDSGPLSPQYMMTQAGPKYLNYSSNFVHGFGAFVGAAIAGSKGSCSASLCPPMTRTLTDQMQSEAVPNRTAEIFLTLPDIPDYSSAIQYISENHGSAVVLTTGSYRAFAIIGVSQGRGIWLDHWKNTGPPRVLLLTAEEGEAKWRYMIEGQTYTPDNYMVLLNSR